MAKPKKQEPELLISQQLRRFILEAGVTQYRICKTAKLHQSQMLRFINTGRGISLETVDRIGQALRLRLVVEEDVDGE